MNVIPAQVGVGQQRRFGVIQVLLCQEQHAWPGIADVTGVGIPVANHFTVVTGTGHYFFQIDAQCCLGRRQQIVLMWFRGLSHEQAGDKRNVTIADPAEDFIRVGQKQMLSAGRLDMFHIITLQQFVDGEGSNRDQSANGWGVVGAGSALSGRFSGNEVGKKAPVVGFGVRVPVPGRIGSDELDIGLQEVIWIVATIIGYDGPHQYRAQ